ncbi:MAG: hypothetical protein JOZ81_23655 [Chloroflexi bacterium]|nr:hypothetical protein [Chloroflexota bacterium]
MSRGAALFLGSVLLALVVGHLLRETPGYVVRDESGVYQGDITHYVYWTRLVTLGGIQSAYSGTWPETYAVYPPVTLYPYWLVGSIYRAVVDPSFDPTAAQQSLWLHEAIKLVALAWHLLTGIALWLLLRRMVSPTCAGVAAAMYVANPAALYDVAHWAQPDGAHALFSVLAIGLLSLGALPWAFCAMALAALAKPQAWAILPLFGIASLRSHAYARVVRGLFAAAAVALAVLAPFILTGHVRDLLSLPSAISTVMPVVSADAHNMWRLVLDLRGQDPMFVNDSTRFVGPLTHRAVAAVLVLGVLVCTAWLYWTRRVGLSEAAALAVLGWFNFTTQAHENHLFFALPLLSLAWPTRRSLLLPFGLLTLTVLLNMLLHDQLVIERLGSSLDDPRVELLRTLNAAANIVVWAGWTALAVARRAMVVPSIAAMGEDSTTVNAGGRSDAVVRTTVPG